MICDEISRFNVFFATVLHCKVTVGLGLFHALKPPYNETAQERSVVLLTGIMPQIDYLILKMCIKSGTRCSFGCHFGLGMHKIA